MRRDFIEARITALETAIAAYEIAIAAFATDGALQSYTLDTGQTKQTVMRADADKLRVAKQSMANELATYCARLDGSVTEVRVGF